MKLCYKSKSGINEILEGDAYHYLLVRNGQGEPERAYAFDGYLMRDGRRIADILGEYIDQYGPFYLDGKGCGARFDSRSGVEDGHRSIIQMVYSLYYPEEKGDFNSLHIRMSSRVPITVLGSAQDKLFTKTYKVFDLSKGNLRSRTHSTYIQARGTVVTDGKKILITSGGEYYFTNYNRELYGILTKATSWLLRGESGEMFGLFGGRGFTLSSVVWAFYHTEDQKNGDRLEAVLNACRDMARSGKEVDHLTENRRNNCIHALALVNKRVNASAARRRTGLSLPCYFLTAYKVEGGGLLLVKCGVEGKYEKRFALGLSDGGEQYRKALNDFIRTARAKGYQTNGPMEHSALFHWGSMERAGDPGNPLEGVLAEPLAAFETYREGALEDMPQAEEGGEAGL